MKVLFVLLAGLLASNAAAQKVAWSPKSDKGFDQAMEERKFVLQYFTKARCTECALLDRTVFKDPDIVNYLDERFVSIRSDIGSPNGKIDAENYGVETYPSILFFNSKGELIEKATMVGVLGANEFLQHLLNVTTEKFDHGTAPTSQIQVTGKGVDAPISQGTAWSKPDTSIRIAPPPLPDTTSPTVP